MGRGLGKTQQAILDYLHQRGKPSYVSDIAYELYHNQEHVKEFEPTPRSFDVSVRRAVHSLSTRSLINLGNAPDPRRLIGDSVNRLVCWLPNQQPPRLTPIICGADVDRFVLAALKSTDAITDEWERCSVLKTFSPPGRPDETFVRYSWLTNQVVKMLGGNMIEGKRIVAIHRSIKRLSAQERIKAYWTSTGRYGWVRLNNLNVAE
jgi:hypothetical protein